ncbi:iron ABC transporter permease, partial [Cyclobacteriaceae bacterium]|nr:iron ABC transporter permease [Cyclobacteriaceae bacterium]
MITQYFDTSLKKWRRLFSGLGALLIVSFAFNISLGSVAIPLSSVIDFILLRPPIDDSWHLIIEKFRLPKALTAVFVGGGLGICGLQMQTL